MVTGFPLVKASLAERAARLEAEAEARRAAASGGALLGKALRGGVVLLLLAAGAACFSGMTGGAPDAYAVDAATPSGGRGRGRKKNATPARKRNASPVWNRRPTNQRMRRDNTRYPE